MTGLTLLGVAGLSYWYYSQQWVETRDLYYAHFKDTAYLLMILGVACIIAFVALFIRLPSEFSSQTVLVVKKCPHCGKTLLEDMKFCPYCGKNLKEDKSTSAQGKKWGCATVCP